MELYIQTQKFKDHYTGLFFIDNRNYYSFLLKYYPTKNELCIQDQEYFEKEFSKKQYSQLSKLFLDIGFKHCVLERNGECGFLTKGIKLTFKEFEEVVEQIKNMIEEVVN